MKIIQINTFPNKATGNIMLQIHELLQKNNINSYVVWGRGNKSTDKLEFTIRDNVGTIVHGFYSRIFDRTGFASWSATKKLLHILDKLNPDIIHLHNLHGYYINIKMLFDYLRYNPHIKVVWTIHDCWPITGHCAYFSAIHCYKWQNGCNDCAQLSTYPKASFVDNSKRNWREKRNLFSQVKLHLVVPSFWLKDILQHSYLSHNDITVIHNGVDLDTFKPMKNKCYRKYTVLGVASEWTDRKGLDDFIKLRDKLEKKYNIVLIGLTKKQIKSMPKGITGLKRTENVKELVRYYSEAMVYVNMSVEETMGMTTVEALACGTPVIVYNVTALPEIVDKRAGIIVDDIHNIDKVVEAIKCIEKGTYNECRSVAELYEKKKQFNKYIKLYRKVYGGEGN